MTKGMERAAKLAAGAHAWEEEVGRLAGDLHPSTSIHNDFAGEIAFAVLVPRVVQAFLPLLGDRPEPVKFHQYQDAPKLGLHVHDYRMIAHKSGKMDKIQAPQEWINEYGRRAGLVYGTGIAEIDYYGGLLQARDWHDRAKALEDTVVRGDSFPPVHIMPHAANLVFRTMQLTAKTDGDKSSFKSAFSDYRRHMEEIGKEYTSDNIGYISDKIALSLVSLSDELVREDPSVWRSGRPFLRFDSKSMTDGDRLVYAGRAISQILAINFLKAAEKRDIQTSALMSDIAYCGWAVTLLGDMHRYADKDIVTSDVLEDQWKLGLNVDPCELQVNETYREDMFQKLVRQVP